MKDLTDGGFLELVNEFEVAGGGAVDPHSHPTHEFYYVHVRPGHHDDRGRGAARSPRATSSTSRPTRSTRLRPISDHAPIHCFCFAIGVKGAGPIDYTTH